MEAKEFCYCCYLARFIWLKGKQRRMMARLAVQRSQPHAATCSPRNLTQRWAVYNLELVFHRLTCSALIIPVICGPKHYSARKTLERIHSVELIISSSIKCIILSVWNNQHGGDLVNYRKKSARTWYQLFNTQHVKCNPHFNVECFI